MNKWISFKTTKYLWNYDSTKTLHDFVENRLPWSWTKNFAIKTSPGTNMTRRVAAAAMCIYENAREKVNTINFASAWSPGKGGRGLWNWPTDKGRPSVSRFWEMQQQQSGRRGWKVKTSEKPVATFSTWNSSTWTVVVFGFGHENKPQRNYGDKRAIVPKWFQVEAEKRKGEEGRRSE